MFIEIKKVISEYKRDGSGNVVKDPISSKSISEGIKLVQETIRVDEIKAARPWRKSKEQEAQIDGEMCILYMLDIDRKKGEGKKPAEILIAESHKAFADRLGSVAIG